eukprot:CAMPEP_0170178964 /NCGR_PEP_ID=MMETSP0040_2-20121228/15612_1 /TAXON_ID=641309 /ORGANISM="Lotharella oceanica, Strain CCMP622" /LENGTH=43 /DNA_ID= /DNA_START= /DNA_END= /DNA_ORIENTATION=
MPLVGEDRCDAVLVGEDSCDAVTFGVLIGFENIYSWTCRGVSI